MIMMTMHFMKDKDGNPHIPFKHVYVTGLIRDENGDKMSKSRGNVLDPLDMIDGIDLESLVEKRCGNMMQPQLAARIEKRTRKAFEDGIAAHGTDALRYTLYSLASTGRDINWDMKRLEGYRNFCNKIWNAASYVQMNTKGKDCGQNTTQGCTGIAKDRMSEVTGSDLELTLADRWIISGLQRLKAQIEKNIADFRLDHASRNLYDFIWNEYCSWYLELSKPVLRDENAPAARKRGTRRTLVRVLETLMRLTHPFMPFITEEIWQNIKTEAGVEGDTLMLKSYPECDDNKIDEKAEQDIEWLKGFIVGIRNIRAELNIGPGKPLNVILRNTSADDESRLEQNRTFLQAMVRLDNVRLLAEGEEAPMATTALVDSMEVLVPMAGLIDKDAEIARLSKDINKLVKEVARFESKLNNEKFIGKAPAAVVEKEKAKLADAIDARSRLEEQMAAIKAL